jgi:hypothetical protein
MATRRATWRSRVGTRVACGVGVLAAGVLAVGAGAAAPVLAGASSRTLAAATPAQKAHATNALLRHSDMPSGWTTSPSTNSGSGSFPGAAQLAGCIGVPSKLIASNPPQVDSPNFHSKDQTVEVDDNVAVFPSVKNARAEYAAISNAKTAGCMATLMNGSFKSQIAASAGNGASVGTITVTKARAPKGTTAYAMSVPITSQGVVIQLQLVIVYFIKGQYGQNITFFGYGVPFPAALQQKLTTVARARL